MPNTWPTLSRSPVVEGFSQFLVEDPTIRARTMDGRPLARPGPGPVLRGWRFSYRYLTGADRALLDTFQETTVFVGGATFSWTDPRPSGTAHTVRLARPLAFDLEDDGVSYRANVEIHEEG
ncbi:MAG: hypothetical protein FJ280_29585 [Planctomycetes bacterium]|nr:hypothetical protein [Planctomycetota bacterium]